MTLLPLIGLIGYKRHGKDRTAQELISAGYQPVAFADPLRDLVEAINPVVALHPDATPTDGTAEGMLRYADVVTDLGYEGAKDDYPEVRRALVATGTAGVRECLGVKWGLNDLLGGTGLWVRLAEKRIRTEALKRWSYNRETDVMDPVWHKSYAFTDVRMPDEADLIKSYHGVLVRVVRTDAPIPPADEETEHALDEYPVDYVLHNDGTPEGLAAEVAKLVDYLKTRSAAA